jgi:hypothetical protein
VKTCRRTFDGHGAPELGVVHRIHFSYPKHAKLRDNFVGTQFCASGDGNMVPATRKVFPHMSILHGTRVPSIHWVKLHGP